MTHNWCDKTTWYTTAIREVAEVATDLGAHTVYALANAPMVDVYHGKISGEDDLLDSGGFSYRVVVTVNGQPKTERDPHLPTSGDFSVNYTAGQVTFFTTLNPSDVVLVTYHRVVNSIWRLTPKIGTVLKIARVEAQFSTDIEINDTIIFQARGLVDAFAPQLMPGIPSGTIIPLGSPVVYKTMMDFINEANGAYPVIPALGTNWRGTPVSIVTFPWDYNALTSIPAAAGMDIELRLVHDVPFGGYAATAAFYCLSEGA
jgi:hypothetical protein